MRVVPNLISDRAFLKFHYQIAITIKNTIEIKFQGCLFVIQESVDQHRVGSFQVK